MATYKRILLKLSGESLMGEKQYGIDEKRLADSPFSCEQDSIVRCSQCSIVIQKAFNMRIIGEVALIRHSYKIFLEEGECNLRIET